MRRKVHPNCVVCGPENEAGLRLEFSLSADGGVQAAFGCAAAYEGFPGVIHGGVISSLLDGAMTNCLFAHGVTGVTGELRVRFRHPVVTNRRCQVRAWIDRSLFPFHVVKAELVQERQIKAKATGKFVESGVFGGRAPDERFRQKAEGESP
ncbi:MAG: PaaI family thioesterase [Pirellulales bacterium]|nr:PaaI family thioesterase [Pirellulales bacterium]